MGLVTRVEFYVFKYLIPPSVHFTTINVFTLNGILIGSDEAWN